jgi:hypothetical protein
LEGIWVILGIIPPFYRLRLIYTPGYPEGGYMGGAREEMKKEGKWGILSVGSLTVDILS